MNNQPETFSLNQKVQISPEYFWAKGQFGIISKVPEEIKKMSSGWENDFSKFVETMNGKKRFYWVRFEVPQLDVDGDGPYEEAEIAESFLKNIT